MLTILCLFGCEGFGHTAEIGEQFTLKTKESAKVRGTGIEIILNRIGRKWGANPRDGESLDLSFTVKYGGNTKTYTEFSPDPIIAGKHRVEIVKTEPFGEGYVIFVVNKTETAGTKPNDAAATAFVEQFDWQTGAWKADLSFREPEPYSFDRK